MNASMTMKLSKRLSFGEEVANSVTHAVGAVAMLDSGKYQYGVHSMGCDGNAMGAVVVAP